MRTNGEGVHIERHDVDLAVQASEVLRKKTLEIFMEAMKDGNSFENSLLCIFLTGVDEGIRASSRHAKKEV